VKIETQIVQERKVSVELDPADVEKILVGELASQAGIMLNTNGVTSGVTFRGDRDGELLGAEVWINVDETKAPRTL
jgi:hypothetical protein